MSVLWDVAEPPRSTSSSSPSAAGSSLRRCLDALLANPAQRQMTVTVVDNDSRDGTVEMVRARLPAGAASSRATRTSASAPRTTARSGPRAADYVLALNPDTRGRTPGALERLCALLEASARRWGIVGTRPSSGPTSTPDHAAQALLPHPPERARPLHGPRGAARESGSGWPPTGRPTSRGGSVDAIDQLGDADAAAGPSTGSGLFDEGYWMYMEDLDLSYRFAGGRLGDVVRALRSPSTT